MDIKDWYQVSFGAETITRKAQPPNGEAWEDSLRFEDIIRVCYQIEDMLVSDGIYLFTSKREESYAIPAEAQGGAELVGELVRRKLFDAKLLNDAMSATEGLFCWPPEEQAAK